MELIITTKDDLKKIISEVLHSVKPTSLESKESEQLIDKKEAAELLGVSIQTIDNYRKEGYLKSYRIGNNIRFKKSELLKAVCND